jgi:heat shock protein HslJ
MRPILTVVVALVIAACGGDPGPSAAPSGGGVVDAAGVWQLESGTLDGAAIPLVAAQPVTMSVSGTQVTGTSACNGYGTEIALVDGRLRFQAMSSTAMLCEDDVMASEVAFHAAIGRVSAARRDGEALVLFGDGVELRFVPLADVPMAGIVDRPWALVSLVEGGVERAPGGEPATVEFRSDGTFAGSTGCRSFTGRWILAVAEVVATDQAMDDRVCPPELQDQDGHVVEVVSGFSAVVDGDTLTMTSRGDLGLVYQRAAAVPGADPTPEIPPAP